MCLRFFNGPSLLVHLALFAVLAAGAACTVSSQAECTTDSDCAGDERCFMSGGVFVRDGACVANDFAADLDAGEDDDAQDDDAQDDDVRDIFQDEDVRDDRDVFDVFDDEDVQDDRDVWDILECLDGEVCSGECVSLENDPDHCGGCGLICESGQCESGQCIELCDFEGVPFGGGEGTSEDPYQICSAGQFLRIGSEEYRDLDFVLSADINFDGEDFEPLGNDDFPFKGLLDGAGYEIHNLLYGDSGVAGVGLFGVLAGEVRDLHLVGVSLSAEYEVGALAAENRGIISDVTADGSVTTFGSFAGGLVGRNEASGVITDSSSDIEIISYIGGESIGGLVGRNLGIVSGSQSHGPINSPFESDGPSSVGGLVGLLDEEGIVESSSSYSEITITGSGTWIGGLVGASHYDSFIESSSAFGSVAAPAGIRVGGMLGGATRQSGIGLKISRGEAWGDVTGNESVGGLVGHMTHGVVEESSAHGTVEGELNTGGLFGYILFYLVRQSYATGSVYGANRSGGLGGRTEYGIVTDSYATGDVTGGDDPAGLIGASAYGGPENSYSFGSVTGDAGGGALVSVFWTGGSAISSYWNSTTSGMAESAGREGLSDLEFQDEGNFEGWDFDDIWEMSASGDRPILRWQ